MTEGDELFTSEMNRRRLLQLGGRGVLGLTAGQFLVACGSSSNDSADKSPTASPAEGKITRGGTLTIAMTSGGKSETIDPSLSNNTPDILRIFNLYDNLFIRDENGQAAPHLAESAEPNADATLWTFRLRSGVMFHDGKELTADDLIYSLNYWGDKANYGSATMQPFIDYKKVRKRDPLTVEIPLKIGATDFPSLTTMANFVILQDGKKPAKGEHVGTGPFKFESFDVGKRSVFSANEEYWQEGKPYVDELIVDSSYTEDSARVNAVLSGQADVIVAMPFPLAKAQEKRGDLVILNQPGPTFQAFTINLEKYDAKVAKALRLIADRQAMVDNVLDGYGTVGNDNAPAGTKFFADDIEIAHDPEQAKALLKEAGEEGLTITIDTGTAISGQLESATLYQEQAKAAGVKVNLKRHDAGAYFDTKEGWLSYPIGQTYWNTPVASLTQFWFTALYSKCLYPETHWGTAETDKLLFDAMAETDEGKAADKWHSLQERHAETGGYLIWAQTNYVDGLTQEVQGVKGGRGGYLGGGRLGDASLKA